MLTCFDSELGVCMHVATGVRMHVATSWSNCFFLFGQKLLQLSAWPWACDTECYCEYCTATSGGVQVWMYNQQQGFTVRVLVQFLGAERTYVCRSVRACRGVSRLDPRTIKDWISYRITSSPIHHFRQAAYIYQWIELNESSSLMPYMPNFIQFWQSYRDYNKPTFPPHQSLVHVILTLKNARSSFN